ncbi:MULTISPECIES: hypothetical protein [Pseudomonas]|uniref:hypothetical protein n=1 Tax=Pseudomonas TaxID=286 RepID=UPI0021C7833E|nr:MULTISPECIES: hypothetical protein [Pseudomonas]MDH0796467.1 hypothetical protein [Pseudomonas carnis]
MDLRDNPYWQALGAVVAELEHMGVDLDEVQRRVIKGLQEGGPYACKDEAKALAGIEALKESIISFQYTRTA